MRWRSALGIAVLAAIVAAAILVVPEGGGGAPPATPTRLASAAAWNGLVGGARAEVGTGQRVLVVLTAFSLADRVQRAGGLATDAEERRWTAGAAAAQQQFISDVGRAGVAIRPEFRFTRTLNGFSAVLDPRAIALIERTAGSEGRLSGTRRVPCVALAASAPPGGSVGRAAGRPSGGDRRPRRADRAARHRRRRRHAVPPRPRASGARHRRHRAERAGAGEAHRPVRARGARHRDGWPARRCRRAGRGDWRRAGRHRAAAPGGRMAARRTGWLHGLLPHRPAARRARAGRRPGRKRRRP